MSIDLDKVIDKQVSRYIDLGFHREVYPNLKDEEAKTKYLNNFTLPQVASQPAEYVGYFDIALVAEPRVSLSRKFELAGITKWINISKIVDLTEHPEDIPYLVFTHTGKLYRPYYPSVLNLTFPKNFEVGSPLLEVTDQFIQDFSLWDGKALDAVGSWLPYNLVPHISSLTDKLHVGQENPTNRYMNWFTSTRGEHLIRLGG